MSQLPQGWSEVRLDSISEIVTGKTPSKKEEDNFGGKIPFIKPGDIHNQGYINSTVETITEKGAELVPSIPKGSITVTCIGNLGRVAIAKEKSATNQQINTAIPNETVESKYLFHYLRTIREWMENEASATTVTIINKTKFSAAPIRLPPSKEEQQRIADKLDSVLAKVETAQARLDKIPTLLKRFRQSVLAAATSGELTKEWRESNKVRDWQQVKLKDVGKGFNYGSSTKSQPEGKIPVLRMGNLQSGKLDWEKLVFTSDDAEIEKYKLHPGDVLFNRTNSPELVGKTSIYRGEREAIFAGYLIKVQGTDRLNTEYLNIQLNSPHARDYCWAVKTDGVSQSNINAKKLQAYEFEIPSIEEQIEIIRVVTELFSSADLVEKQYKAAKLRVDKMTQSILARAFRGKLFSPISEEDRTDVTVNVQSSELQQTKREQPKVIDKEPELQTEVVSVTEIESSNEHVSEVFQLLKNNNKSMSAQALFDALTDNTFSAIDDLFSELKKLIEQKVVIQAGEGENSTFKVTKK